MSRSDHAGLRLASRYLLATIEADRGNGVRATELFKGIIADPATAEHTGLVLIGDYMHPASPYPSQVAQYPIVLWSYGVDLRAFSQTALEELRAGRKVVYDKIAL